ncbi:MAG: site-specific integrase [Ramlibacter sp.]|nr:site-specific integrase [Ramlibacter sp.]
MGKKRDYGTGHLYIDRERDAYYGRWRTAAGRHLHRKVGPVRHRGESDGLTRAEAEKKFRKMQEDEDRKPRPAVSGRHTVDDVADSLRQKQVIEGARKSYKEHCESMQRVHISPALGRKPVDRVTTAQVEKLAEDMLAKGLAPKSVRNLMTFLHSVFEHAIHKKWATENPVRHATRPKRRRQNDADPDLKYLTLNELDRVLEAIPNEVVHPAPAPTRRGRGGPAPPVPPDVWGPVLRVIVLIAAITGLWQSELLGLRWRHVDWVAQRIRVRNAYVRGEHSGEGKSDESTRRSVPIADEAVEALKVWKARSAYGAPDDLVFCHPESGKELDGAKVTRKFKQACRDAEVRVIRFHDLRHTFGTQMAAAGTPLRFIQEMLGHADAKTTQIYSHYQPSEREVEMVNTAFARDRKNDG